LKQGTNGFKVMDGEILYGIVMKCPISFVVVRAILGLTPPEWAYLASQASKTDIAQGFVRTLDRNIRSSPLKPLRSTGEMGTRIRNLIETAAAILKDGVPDIPADRLHRLDKADTRFGSSGIRSLAQIGVPYAMLLYERFLGRPFAGHRDSVDQAPDFIIPSEFNPQVIIEAKITEDYGTARDKVTRIQHLAELSRAASKRGKPGYEVIACIGGRGFGVRREDMKKMLLATNGKVFTLRTLDRLVECTRLKTFESRPNGR